MKSRILMLSFLLNFSLLNAKEVTSKLPPGLMETPYEACKGVLVVSKEKYEKFEEQWKALESKCKIKVQVAEEAGITRLGSLREGTQYLNLGLKVTEKIMDTLDKSTSYAQCSKACFSGATSCSAKESGEEKEIKCSELKAETLKSLKIQSRKIRMALALSQGNSKIEKVDVGNVLTIDDDKRFNKDLRGFEIGTPNPVGETELQPEEVNHALAMIHHDREVIDAEYKKHLLANSQKEDPIDLAILMMNQVDKRQNENQEKYRHLIFEESPIFAVIEKPVKFENGQEPIWTDKQIADAFQKLADNAKKTKEIVKVSHDRGKLEFRRDQGEALTLWLKSLIPGTQDSNDLLYYMGMKNQVEEVLKADKSMCGAATTMSNRLTSKEIQNTGVVFVGSFAGGTITKGVSKTAVGIFRVGRALSAAEASGLTGLAIGSAFLGDSFRQYNSSVAEITSGVQVSKELEGKRTNVVFNLVFAPTLGPSGWKLGKTIYNSLGKKMATDLPEISKLMKQAGTNQAARDQIVDKWIVAKVKKAIKSNIIDTEDETVLKSEAGGKILDSLASDIQKTNPDFFKDPTNFDFLLKAAASTLKKRPGDPADLGAKAQNLFLSINMDAFNTWDPKARMGLMKVFNEGVEELRSVYIKDPAAYAKFPVDSDSLEKIMKAALKRAGVADEADISAMNVCMKRNSAI